MSTERSQLEAELAAAEAEVTHVRKHNAALAEAFRSAELPTEEAREELKRAAGSLAAARDRVEVARAALRIFDKTGDAHGVVTADGKLLGSIAVHLPPGISREERGRILADALAAPLADAASELGAVLGTSPERFTRERPGRDEQGRTVLDVLGRVEGDVLVPAVSRAAAKTR